MHVHRTYICLGGGGAFFQCHELKRTRSKENEKLPYLFRSRFNSIRFNSLNDCRKMLVCKCTCMNSHYPHNVPFCYLQSLWLRARDFGDIYLCNVCACVCCIALYLLVNFSSIDQYLNGYLISFHIVVHSSDHSFLIIDASLPHSIRVNATIYAEGPVTHWQLHPKTYLLPQQLHFADVLQAQNFSTPMNKTILRNICIYINSFK